LECSYRDYTFIDAEREAWSANVRAPGAPSLLDQRHGFGVVKEPTA